VLLLTADYVKEQAVAGARRRRRHPEFIRTMLYYPARVLTILKPHTGLLDSRRAPCLHHGWSAIQTQYIQNMDKKQ
jgi:hypothetical protein